MKISFSIRIIFLAIIVAGIIGLALWLKAASNEDSWLCVSGQWVKHGNPSTAQPTTPCSRANVPAGKRKETAPLAPSDQLTASFADDDFSFLYPNWPIMDQERVLEPERTKVAVSAAGCAIVLTARLLPPTENFRTAMERLLSEQVSESSIRILQKDITERTSHIEGEFQVEYRNIHTDQYGFVTRKNQFYSLVFAAEQDAFDAACKPVIAGTVKSVKVQ